MADAPPAITGIHETVLYAPDLDTTVGFYERVFGFPRITLSDRGASFRVDNTSVLLLFQPELAADETDGKVPAHGATGPGHICFSCEPDGLGAWRARLKKLGIAIEMERDWPTGARSIYFRDPAGNSVEIADGDIWRSPDEA